VIEKKHVAGKDKGQIMLYALSTCVWCKKTKKLLDGMGVAYDYVDVDLLDDKKSDEADAEVRKWNPKGNYPTIIIDNDRCISGFDEDKIKELGK